MPENKPPVSVLGLGMMGTALAAAFLKAGHPVTVWNRSPAKTGPLVAQGALPAKAAAEAVADSPLVVFCLLTNDNVEELFATLPEAVAGKTLVNLTNGTPAQDRDLAAWAAKHGVHYIDGGIMAVPQMIAGPHAYVLYSGDEQAYETHRPTLPALGGTKWTGTDPGLAALQDLALLTGMYGMFMGGPAGLRTRAYGEHPGHRILRTPGPLDQRDARGRAGAGQGGRLGTAPDGCFQPRRQPGRVPELPGDLP
jgi:6-phosphogluconate dehydrogenase (decarboxylating)